PIVEEDFKPLSIPEMTVWDADHPRPASGPDFERSLLRSITQDSARQMAALAPTDEKSLAEFRRVVGGAFDAMIGSGLPAASAVEINRLTTTELSECKLTTAIIRNLADQHELPALILEPKKWNRQVVIWADGAGKARLFEGSELRPAVKRLLDAGAMVVGVDLLYQGEFLPDGKPLEKTRRVANSRDYAGFTYGYNRPLFAERVLDLLTVITAVTSTLDAPEKVHLVGTGGAGAIAAAARAQAGDAADRLAIDTGGFHFADISSIDDPDFLPGGAKYGDVEALLGLSAPHELWITGESPNRLSLAQAAYRAAGDEKRLTIDKASSDGAESRAIDWLLRP
ncbi:MAG TPA: hypothetical protein VGH32_11485, partial [Pirellulales bacterium]